MTERLRRAAWKTGLLALAALVAGCASAPADRSGPLPFPNAPAGTWGNRGNVDAPAASALLELATSLRGVPYRLGGTNPGQGFDCSGFVRYVFGHFNVEVPRTVAEQYRVGRNVSGNRLAAGDLLFFSTIGPGPTHVGIVIDPAAKTFVHAPGTGSVVRVERFDTSYWSRRVLGARRWPVDAATQDVRR